jgi:hypothetical protein
MRTGEVALGRVFRYSKLIALVAVLFLLSSNLDNQPDCPELLNSNSGFSVSFQTSHHHHAGVHLDKIYTAWGTFDPLMATEEEILVPVLVTPPSCFTGFALEAADSSPPCV